MQKLATIWASCFADSLNCKSNGDVPSKYI